ncbi:hypothetical protein [Desulfobacula sp.]|uniref:hypothetical protein n=1 Tax=Desulfobacula sp. TaxID=2593537 RepID=UPI002619E61C|nr:hypothetical protein [Desulfobacula sp.]
MAKKINSVVFEGTFRVCPACGYTDGFHTMLKQVGETVKWLFICPSCHEIFDIGYTVNNLIETESTGRGAPGPMAGPP